MIMNRPLRLLWIPLAVMTAIFLFSSQSAERQSIRKPLTEMLGSGRISTHLSRMTIHYGTLTVDGKTEGPAAVAEFFLRKLAHLTEYALLGLCLVWAIGLLTDIRLTGAIFLAVSGSAAYAALDEFHQIFVRDRGPRPQDVLLDTAGALAGVLVYAAWRKWKQARISRAAGLGVLQRWLP